MFVLWSQLSDMISRGDVGPLLLYGADDLVLGR